MREKFRFYKADLGRWYIDISGWTVSLDELEMVQGADAMLDRVSGYTKL